MQQIGRRTWLRIALQALVGAMVGAVVVGLHSLTTIPRTYRSSATLVFPLSGTGTAGVLSSVLQTSIEVPAGSDFPLDTYRAVLTSDRALLATAKQLRLPELYKLGTDQAVIAFMKGVVSAKIDVNRTITVASQVRGTPSVLRASDLTNRGAANARDERYRQLAATVIDTLIGQMGLIAEEVKLDRTKAQLDAVTRQVEAQKAELDQTQQEMVRLQSQLGNVDPESYAQGLGTLLVDARREVNNTTAELSQARAERAAAAALLKRQAANVRNLPDEVPFVADRRQAQRKAQQAYDEQSRKYGPESPQVLSAKAELEAANRSLRDALATARSGLEPTLMEIDTRIASLTARLADARRTRDELEREARRLPGSTGRLLSLRAEIESRREWLAQLGRQLVTAQMEYEKRGVRWNVLDIPRPPLRKSSPSTMKALMLGAMIGGLLLGWPALLLLYRQLLSPEESAPAS